MKINERWMFVAGGERQSLPPELVEQALSAAPSSVADGGGIMPRQRDVDSKCRICGETDAIMSREHVPPRAAGNSGRLVTVPFSNWLERDASGARPGPTIQGGIWGYALCVGCNSGTSRLATEYGLWSDAAKRLFRDALPPIEQMDHQVVSPLVAVGFEQVLPGVFGRQVLSMMCTVCGPWELAQRHPEIRGCLLDGDPVKVPTGMSLWMGLCAGPSAAIVGPSLILNLERQSFRWVASLAYPPFLFELTLAATPGQEPIGLCEIGGLLELEESARADLRLEMIVGFTHSALPCDWRTAVQIDKRTNLFGQGG